MVVAAKMTALLGSCRRTGRWKIAARSAAFVFLGNCSIDYREAYVGPDDESIRLSVFCVLGRATFIVPEGSDVQPSVVSLLGSTVFDVPEVDAESPLPTLIIDSTTLLGRCRILTAPLDAAQSDAGLSSPSSSVAARRKLPIRVDVIGSSRSAARQS